MDVKPLPKTPRLPKSIEDGNGASLIKQLYKSFTESTVTVNALVSKAESTVKKTDGLMEVVDGLVLKTTVEDWHEATLMNGWVNYGSGLTPAGYYKDGAGRVFLRGLVRSGTAQAAIFILPEGYRPAYREVMAGIANDSFCRIDVLANGLVVWITGGTNAWVSLDGISFRAA